MSRASTIGAIGASRRRSAGTPVVLGYNTKGTDADSSIVGRKRVSVCTLAVGGTLTELHGWFRSGASACRYIICLYADDGSASPGAPGALVAATAPLTPALSSDSHLQQAGFAVAVAAGKYWVGYVVESTVTGAAALRDIGLAFPPYYSKAINTGAAFDPPSNPFGTPDVNNSGRVQSCWGVVLV